MYRIRLSDGTEYPARFCAARGNLLTMSIETGSSFLALAHAFSDYADPVVFLYDSTEQVFEGFSELVMINGSTRGEYLITLRKGLTNGAV